MFGILKKIFFFVLIIYFTVSAIAKLFNLELNDLSGLFTTFLIPYDTIIDPPFKLAKLTFSSIGIDIPNFVRDITVIWIGLGRIVRKAITDIAAELKDKTDKYNPQAQKPLSTKIQEFLSSPVNFLVGWFKNPVVKESIIATIFWPFRIFVDIKGGFWSLSPKKVSIYIVISFMVLGGLVIMDSYIKT